MLLRLWVRVVHEEKGLATVEWIGLAVLMLAAMAVIAVGLQKADGTNVATRILDAIGRMVDKIN